MKILLIVVDPKHVRKTYIVAGQVRTFFFSTERLIFLIFNTNSQDKRSRVRLSTHLQRQRPWCVSVHTSSHHNNDHCFQLVTRNYSKHVEKLAIVMRISVEKASDSSIPNPEHPLMMCRHVGGRVGCSFWAIPRCAGKSGNT